MSCDSDSCAKRAQGKILCWGKPARIMASNTASVVYIPSLKDLIFAVIIFSSMFSVTAAWCAGGCFKEGFVCCNSACIQGSSCVGLRCSNYDFCSSGETCCNNICVNGRNQIPGCLRPDWCKPWVSTKNKDKKMLLWQIMWVRTNFDL